MIKSIACAALTACSVVSAFSLPIDPPLPNPGGPANSNIHDATLPLAGRINTISIIGVAFGGHRAADFEVEISGGFAGLPGLTCTDKTFLTTLASTDADGQLQKLLSGFPGARTPGIATTATITDDPALNAFPGRCSIKSISRN